jgi:formate dehydrogenase major subunit
MGCKLKYIVEDNKIVKVAPVEDDSVSRGKPCIKGLTINEVVDDGRILKPMIREGRKLREINWKKTFSILYRTLSRYSPEEIFFTGSGKITNEDNFVMQKFVRKVLNSNNIDNCCSRLCHMPTLIALKDSFGIGASPGYIDEVEELDCLIVAGSNPASNHPVLFNRIVKMKRKGGKLVVISTLISETSKIADLFIQITPGAETLFFNTLMNVIIEKRMYRKTPEGFEKLKEIIKSYTPEEYEKISGGKKEDIYKLVNLLEVSKRIGIIHGMGLTQHSHSVEIIHSLLNFAMLLDAKVLTNRGEINVQGCGDMLAFPSPLLFNEDVNQENLKKYWKNVPLRRGMNLIEAIGFGNAKVAVVVHFNPAQSMPDLNRIHENLRKMYLIQLDSYFNLTSNFAKLILPSPLLIEREGTITTGERRVRLVRKVRNPPGEAIEEWKIFCRLAKMFNAKGFEYKNTLEIFKEITKIVNAYANIDAEELYNGKDFFADKRIKFYKLNPERFSGLESVRSKDYPFFLFTFRSPFHFLTNEATGKSETLKKISKAGPFFYINKEDAKRLKIKNKEKIVVKSRVGSVIGYALLDERIPKGYVGAHFHFDNFLINKLFPLEFDPRAFTPNFKCVAVKIIKGDK